MFGLCNCDLAAILELHCVAFEMLLRPIASTIRQNAGYAAMDFAKGCPMCKEDDYQNESF